MSRNRALVAMVVSYRRADLLRRCLDSARKQLPDVEVLVWDNRSAGTPEVRALATDFDDVTWVFSDTNVGFAAAVNSLAERRPDADLLLLNPDAELTGDLSRSRAALALPGTGVASPTVIDPDGQARPWDVAHRGQSVLRSLVSHAGYSERLRGKGVSELYSAPRFDSAGTATVDGYLTGCALLISRPAWNEAGGFDERFYVYGEETDLQQRLVRTGWTLRLVDELHVRHRGHGTVSDDPALASRSADLLRNHHALLLGVHGNSGRGMRFLAALAVLDRVQRSSRRTRRVARRRAGDGAQVVLTTNELVRGGAERQRVQLAGELAARGYPVTLVCLQGLGPLQAEIDPRVRVLLNPWWLPFPSSLETRDRDTVVITDITNTEVGFALAVTRSRGQRRPSWLLASHHPPKLDAPTYGATLGRAAQRADGLIALSPAHLQQLTRFQRLPTPSYLAPNGVPDTEHAPRPAPRSPLRLGMLSRIVEHKNPHLLMEALRPLAGLEWTLDIFGDGPDRTRLQALTPPELTARIRWRGWASGPQQTFPQIDVLCVPSETEAFPLAVVEAMAAGVPVVAAGVCSVPDMLNHGAAGVVVPPGSLAGWTEALRAVISHPEDLGALADAARLRQRTLYTVAAMADHYESAIGATLDRRGGCA